MAAADRTKGPARTSVWLEGGPAPKRRTEHPAGLDRDKIISATVRLLDAEGLVSFSMRRLAAELGVTAMSVYWYVDTKGDLLELALDRANAEMRLPGEDAGDWCDQLRHLALEYRKLLVTHPWVAQLMGMYINIGPHAMAFADVAQRVMRTSGLPDHGVTGGLSAVFQFVYGFGAIEGNWATRCRAAGVGEDEYVQQVLGALEGRPEVDGPMRTMGTLGGGTVQEMRERDFSYALEIIIAGIEAMADRDRNTAGRGRARPGPGAVGGRPGADRPAEV
jgi:AcrR family transcriptional regulator